MPPYKKWKKIVDSQIQDSWKHVMNSLSDMQTTSTSTRESETSSSEGGSFIIDSTAFYENLNFHRMRSNVMVSKACVSRVLKYPEKCLEHLTTFCMSTWCVNCKKMQKKENHNGFLKASTLSVLRCTWTGWIIWKNFWDIILTIQAFDL